MCDRRAGGRFFRAPSQGRPGGPWGRERREPSLEDFRQARKAPPNVPPQNKNENSDLLGDEKQQSFASERPAHPATRGGDAGGGGPALPRSGPGPRRTEPGPTLRSPGVRAAVALPAGLRGGGRTLVPRADSAAASRPLPLPTCSCLRGDGAEGEDAVVPSVRAAPLVLTPRARRHRRSPKSPVRQPKTRSSASAAASELLCPLSLCLFLFCSTQ